MRKIRFKPVAVLAAVLIPLMAAAGVITHTATYDYSNLTLGTDTLGGVTYTTVSYEGLYNGGDPGMPSLPIDYLRFSVPYNATNFSVTASIGATVISSINHLVYPCQAPRMMNDTTPVTITLPDTSAYYTNTLYPSQRAWVVDEGFLAGENHIVTVAVMPIAYKHASSGMIRNSIRKSSSISLTLSYSISDSTSMRPIVREDSVLRQEGYQLTQSMVINPSQVKPNSPSVFIPIDTLPNQSREGGLDPFFPPHDSLVVDTTGIGTSGLNIFPKYLIITTQELSHSLRRLAALKRQKGYSVRIVTLDDITNYPHASHGDIIKKADGTIYIPYGDDAGKIRQYLKYAFQWGTEYVLLAGSDIPYRTHDGYKAHGDLYYSELNSDWKCPNIGNKPDIYVGRLFGTTDIQFDNYSDKLFRYELNPGKGDMSYLKRALYTESIDFVGYLSEPSRNLSSIFSDTTFIREILGTSYPKGCDIIDSINNTQYGFINTFNHGEPFCIRTCGKKNQSPYYFLWAIDTVKITGDLETGNGLNRISNKYYPLIYYSPSCETIPYYKISNSEEYINYGESFTMGKDYGGPVYIGNTQSINTNLSKELALRFSEQIKEGNYILSEAYALSKMYLTSSFITYGSIYHNYIGDPCVKLWSDVPNHFANITVSRNNHSITVSGLSGSDSTIVAYTDNDGYSQIRMTTSATTFNNVSPNGTIMLYKHNYIPYIAPLFLQNVTLSKSQYVIASDVTAGRSIDSGRTNGDVVVKSGVEYEIEAAGTVTLDRGFEVEKGAIFAVYPSSF